MTRFNDYSRKKNQLFVCEYSTAPVIGRKIFVEGSPASSCKSGENPNYPGLCSPDEEIDPNNYGQHKNKNQEIMY
jgi:hypothetical protein